MKDEEKGELKLDMFFQNPSPSRSIGPEEYFGEEIEEVRDPKELIEELPEEVLLTFWKGYFSAEENQKDGEQRTEEQKDMDSKDEADVEEELPKKKKKSRIFSKKSHVVDLPKKQRKKFSLFRKKHEELDDEEDERLTPEQEKELWDRLLRPNLNPTLNPRLGGRIEEKIQTANDEEIQSDDEEDLLTENGDEQVQNEVSSKKPKKRISLFGRNKDKVADDFVDDYESTDSRKVELHDMSSTSEYLESSEIPGGNIHVNSDMWKTNVDEENLFVEESGVQLNSSVFQEESNLSQEENKDLQEVIMALSSEFHDGSFYGENEEQEEVPNQENSNEVDLDSIFEENKDLLPEEHDFRVAIYEEFLADSNYSDFRTFLVDIRAEQMLFDQEEVLSQDGSVMEEMSSVSDFEENQFADYENNLGVGSDEELNEVDEEIEDLENIKETKKQKKPKYKNELNVKLKKLFVISCRSKIITVPRLLFDDLRKKINARLLRERYEQLIKRLQNGQGHNAGEQNVSQNDIYSKEHFKRLNKVRLKLRRRQRISSIKSLIARVPMKFIRLIIDKIKSIIAEYQYKSGLAYIEKVEKLRQKDYKKMQKVAARLQEKEQLRRRKAAINDVLQALHEQNVNELKKQKAELQALKEGLNKSKKQAKSR